MSRSTVFNCHHVVDTIDQGYAWIKLNLEDNSFIKWYRAQMKLTNDGSIRVQAMFGFTNVKDFEFVQKLIGESSLEVTTDKDWVYYYCTDEAQRIVGSTLMQRGEFTVRGKRWQKDFEYACTLGNFHDSMDYMLRRHPRHLRGSRKLHHKLRALQPCTIKYTLDQFTVPRIPQEELETKTIVLIGTTWLGKTNFALAHFKNPAIIRSKSDYAAINPLTDGIIFDDMEICTWKPSDFKNIVDLKVTGRQKIKYGSIFLPEGVPRIIINLAKRHFWPKSLFGKDGMVSPDVVNDYEAIKENIIIKNIDKPLYNTTMEEIEKDINENGTTLGMPGNPNTLTMKRKRRAAQRPMKKLKTPDI